VRRKTITVGHFNACKKTALKIDVAVATPLNCPSLEYRLHDMRDDQPDTTEVNKLPITSFSFLRVIAPMFVKLMLEPA